MGQTKYKMSLVRFSLIKSSRISCWTRFDHGQFKPKRVNPSLEMNLVRFGLTRVKINLKRLNSELTETYTILFFSLKLLLLVL